MTMTVEAVPGQKLYRAVVDALRHEIETGRSGRRNCCRPSACWCELLDVSRTTLRKAIADLVAEGLLLHRHGAGTFISSCEAARRSALVAPDEFYGRHAAARFEASSRELRARRVPADAGRGDDARRGAERTRVPARPFATR